MYCFFFSFFFSTQSSTKQFYKVHLVIASVELQQQERRGRAIARVLRVRPHGYLLVDYVTFV